MNGASLGAGSYDNCMDIFYRSVKLSTIVLWDDANIFGLVHNSNSKVHRERFTHFTFC